MLASGLQGEVKVESGRVGLGIIAGHYVYFFFSVLSGVNCCRELRDVAGTE